MTVSGPRAMVNGWARSELDVREGVGVDAWFGGSLIRKRQSWSHFNFGDLGKGRLEQHNF
jgi:hypothetical protein